MWKTLIGFFVLIPFLAGASKLGAPIEGSTYFLHQSFSLPSTMSCSAALDDLSRTLFGTKDEYRHLALYTSLRCSGTGAQPLVVEAVMEPSSEAERTELENWMRVLESLKWQNQSLSWHDVNSIFWNTYGLALKGDGSVGASFEKPRVATSFAEVLNAKAEMKRVLNFKDPGPLFDLLRIDLSSDEFESWRQDILPVASKLEFCKMLSQEKRRFEL